MLRGEFLTLLGPSGSGKTTTLMMLAGFETPTAGEILLDGKPLSHKPPYQRDIGMVFQNYALFPHMTVAENIAFPLSVRGVAAADMRTRVERALDMVQLEGFGDRRPPQLSGGQQQRIALARALVFEPKLILMDEPLGALDKQLREQMQLEIRRLHQRLGVTMVYVTHDQDEALTMSDRIAVFHRGRIQQLGTPERSTSEPANAFVARFIGENNRLDGVVESADREPLHDPAAGGHSHRRLAREHARARHRRHGLAAPGTGANPRAPGIQWPTAATRRLEGTLREVIYLGDHVRLRVALPGNDEFMVKRPIERSACASRHRRRRGARVGARALPRVRAGRCAAILNGGTECVTD